MPPKPTTTVPSITVEIQVDIPVQRFNDLLVGAFEGGSNYWYLIESRHRPEGAPAPAHVADYAHLEGHWLMIGNKFGDAIDGRKQVKLERYALIRGAEIMAVRHPRHWANFMNENNDAETSDVFLQCCLFGELVYG